ncbi:MAG: transcriptional regulator GcvA [Proteobacteria bacterium]|nr:transcriptional regulator GcvA [Pseudomonadota bacterium]
MALLPPLNSLRAFESAGRHLSFSKAALELSVTTGAISQQIRTLEEFLDIKLFKRRSRSIVLTEPGQIFLPLLSEGFTRITEAVDTVRRSQRDGPLTISAAPSFTSRWLIPRLCKFQARHPEIDVRIDASSRLVDFVREDIDVGIRFGTGEFEGLDPIYLFSFDLIAVCSPDLIRGSNGLLDISDIADYTLLHNEDANTGDSWPDWGMWLATAGIDDIDASRGIFFNQGEMIINAAIEGQGIALVGNVLAAGEIEAGRLVQLFETKLPVRLSFHLVTSRQKARSTKVTAFREWILEESAYLRAD